MINTEIPTKLLQSHQMGRTENLKQTNEVTIPVSREIFSPKAFKGLGTATDRKHNEAASNPLSAGRAIVSKDTHPPFMRDIPSHTFSASIKQIIRHRNGDEIVKNYP